MYRRSPGRRSAASIVLDSFLDNFSGAGLFGKLRWPGAPTEFFDSRTVEEYVASGEYHQTIRDYSSAIVEMRKDRAAGAAITEARMAAAAAPAARKYEEHALHG